MPPPRDRDSILIGAPFAARTGPIAPKAINAFAIDGGHSGRSPLVGMRVGGASPTELRNSGRVRMCKASSTPSRRLLNGSRRLRPAGSAVAASSRRVWGRVEVVGRAFGRIGVASAGHRKLFGRSRSGCGVAEVRLGRLGRAGNLDLPVRGSMRLPTPMLNISQSPAKASDSLPADLARRRGVVRSPEFEGQITVVCSGGTQCERTGVSVPIQARLFQPEAFGLRIANVSVAPSVATLGARALCMSLGCGACRMVASGLIRTKDSKNGHRLSQA